MGRSPRRREAGRLALAALAAALLQAAPAGAQEELAGDGIKSLISGKQIYLSTPYGLELPLSYRADGSVSGDVSGFSMASMFAPKETGKWWVDGKSLCQQWPTWYDGKKFCFTIRQTGEGSISWTRDDGLSGTARIKS